MFVHIGCSSISQPVFLFSFYVEDGNYLPCCLYRALSHLSWTTSAKSWDLSHCVCTGLCVILFFLDSAGRNGQAGFVTCIVILLIWRLPSLPSSLSLSLSLSVSLLSPHPTPSPFPRQHVAMGYVTTELAACLCMCICACLCGCLWAWEIKHETRSFQVLLAFRLM